MEYYVENDFKLIADSGIIFFEQKNSANSVAAQGHIHETIEFIYTVSGEFDFYINDNHYVVGKDEMLLFRSNAIHRIYTRAQSENAYYVLKIKPSLIYELADKANATSYILRFSLGGGKEYWSCEELEKNGRIKEAFKRLIAENSESTSCRDVGTKLAAFYVVLETLRDIIQNETETTGAMIMPGSVASQIYKVIKYISESYGEDISAERCAKAVNMSYSYFSRSFKRITGSGFKEYLNSVRLSQAERLLASSDKSIMEVSLECGYDNVSYFIMLFRRHKGVTPLEYRKNTV